LFFDTLGNGYPNGYPFFNGIAHDMAGMAPTMDRLETVVFSAIRADIDESRSDYMQNVDNSKRVHAPERITMKTPGRGG
jgi:hypothetical protein